MPACDFPLSGIREIPTRLKVRKRRKRFPVAGSPKTGGGIPAAWAYRAVLPSIDLVSMTTLQRCHPWLSYHEALSSEGFCPVCYQVWLSKPWQPSGVTLPWTTALEFDILDPLSPCLNCSMAMFRCSPFWILETPLFIVFLFCVYVSVAVQPWLFGTSHWKMLCEHHQADAPRKGRPMQSLHRTDGQI